MEACVITSEEPGGIATLQISGRDVLTMLQPYFRSKRRLQFGSRIYYGTIVEPESQLQIDEVIVACYCAQESITSEAMVEINCHGGKASAAAILSLFKKIRIYNQQQWQQKFAGNGIIEQHALSNLLHSQTELAAKVFLYQFQGELRSALQQILALMATNPAQAEEQAIHLANTAKLGLALSKPQSIVITGNTNVGKSTLFNHLLGRKRAIIDGQPGTTRDSLREFIDIKGMPFYLTDTAGVRAGKDLIEQIAIENTQKNIQQAQILLWVNDASRPPATQMPDVTAKHNFMVVVNKTDVAPNYLQQYLMRFPGAIIISAYTGQGVNRLTQALIAPFVDLFPQQPAPLIFTMCQLSFLNQAIVALQRGNVPLARDCLQKLLANAKLFS